MFKKCTIYWYKVYKKDKIDFAVSSFLLLSALALAAVLTGILIVAFIDNFYTTSLVVLGIIFAILIPITLAAIGKHNSVQGDQ